MREASGQCEPGAYDAHGKRICTSDTAGDRSDDSLECLLEGEVDAGLADMDSLDRVTVDGECVAGDVPCVLKAKRECDPREAGRYSELRSCDVFGVHSSYGDVKRCMVLR